MLRIFTRHSNDVAYFTDDRALELDTLRDGGPGWWLRGEGDTRAPRDVARVFTTTDRSRVEGYDLVIAAPRPVSILIALDPEHASGVIDAHRASVAATVDYLEDRALIVRDRRGAAARDETGRWTKIVSFTHGLNRHGEPHLHDHVLVGARPEGSRTVLDSRSLFVHANTADALYRSSLRFELARRTPWTAWRSFNGVEHVAELDEGYRALWGGHFNERGEKLAWSREEAKVAWRRDLDRFEPQGVVKSPERSTTLDEHSFAGAFEGNLHITRRAIVSAWANAARFGQAPRGIASAVDALYPSLVESRGVREMTVGVARARMTGRVREEGPRPLDIRSLGDWDQRSRERSIDSDRSR
jgi:hypothetical protein